MYLEKLSTQFYEFWKIFLINTPCGEFLPLIIYKAYLASFLFVGFRLFN